MAVVKKNRSGYGYDYTDLGAILEYLESAGVEVQQTLQHDQTERVVVTRSRAKGEEEWGEWLAPVPVIVGQGAKMSAMQMLGSAITYARRYSIQLALGLAASDDDGAGSGQQAPQQPAAPQIVSKPGVTTEQRSRISDLMKQGGVRTKEQAVIVFKQLTGRDIKSTHELELAEVEGLLSAPTLVVSRTKKALAPQAPQPEEAENAAPQAE